MAPQAKQIAATICTISTYQSVHPWSSILTNSISNRASAFSINRQNYYVYLNTSISIKNLDIKFSANDGITFIKKMYAQNRKIGKPNNLKFCEQ